MSGGVCIAQQTAEHKPDVTAQICGPSAEDTEVGGQRFKATLGYTNFEANLGFKGQRLKKKAGDVGHTFSHTWEAEAAPSR